MNDHLTEILKQAKEAEDRVFRHLWLDALRVTGHLIVCVAIVATVTYLCCR